MGQEPSASKYDWLKIITISLKLTFAQYFSPVDAPEFHS